MKLSKNMLLAAGILSLLIALFQAVISFSIEWSRYFGAPEELLSNPILLYTTGFITAAVFALFGLYGFSGAGTIKQMPFLRTGLLIIGIIYILRGLFALPIIFEISIFMESMGAVDPSEPYPSLISLLTGLLYLIGTCSSWRGLKR